MAFECHGPTGVSPVLEKSALIHFDWLRLGFDRRQWAVIFNAQTCFFLFRSKSPGIDRNHSQLSAVPSTGLD
jgi:hypothetical protein